MFNFWKKKKQNVNSKNQETKLSKVKTNPINWKNDDNYYYSRLESGTDKKDAVKQLILKILELSKNHEDWNSLILDKWIFNLGRLIGNIQNKEEAIGLDRGYRVGVQFKEYYARLENSKGKEYDEVLDNIEEEIENLIFDVLEDPEVKSIIKEYQKLNQFVIEISNQGQRIGISIKP